MATCCGKSLRNSFDGVTRVAHRIRCCNGRTKFSYRLNIPIGIVTRRDRTNLTFPRMGISTNYRNCCCVRSESCRHISDSAPTLIAFHKIENKSKPKLKSERIAFCGPHLSLFPLRYLRLEMEFAGIAGSIKIWRNGFC